MDWFSALHSLPTATLAEKRDSKGNSPDTLQLLIAVRLKQRSARETGKYRIWLIGLINGVCPFQWLKRWFRRFLYLGICLDATRIQGPLPAPFQPYDLLQSRSPPIFPNSSISTTNRNLSRDIPCYSTTSITDVWNQTFISFDLLPRQRPMPPSFPSAYYPSNQLASHLLSRNRWLFLGTESNTAAWNANHETCHHLNIKNWRLMLRKAWWWWILDAKRVPIRQLSFGGGLWDPSDRLLVARWPTKRGWI